MNIFTIYSSVVLIYVPSVVESENRTSGLIAINVRKPLKENAAWGILHVNIGKMRRLAFSFMSLLVLYFNPRNNIYLG